MADGILRNVLQTADDNATSELALPQAKDLLCLQSALNHLRMTAFEQSFSWDEDRMAVLFPGCQNSRRAAAAYARRMLQNGLFRSAVFQVVQTASIDNRPLCSSAWQQQPNFERLAYKLDLRFSGASRPTRIYWPSAAFAKWHGSWTGTNVYPCPHKISHDLLVTAVWLRYLAVSPESALTKWIPERRLQWESRRGGRRGPIPDALVVDGARTTAIEIGGNYPATWIRHHVERFEAAGWSWELW